MSEEIDDATMEAYHKANSEWLAKQGFTPLDRETYEKIRKLNIEMMEGELEGFRKLSSLGVTFTDKQKEAIQKRQEQGHG